MGSHAQPVACWFWAAAPPARRAPPRGDVQDGFKRGPEPAAILESISEGWTVHLSSVFLAAREVFIHTCLVSSPRTSQPPNNAPASCLAVHSPDVLLDSSRACPRPGCRAELRRSTQTYYQAAASSPGQSSCPPYQELT